MNVCFVCLAKMTGTPVGLLATNQSVEQVYAIELQGYLRTQSMDGEIPAQVMDEGKGLKIVVSQHNIEGVERPLTKPMLILKRHTIRSWYEVVGLVTKKCVFSERPQISSDITGH